MLYDSTLVDINDLYTVNNTRLKISFSLKKFHILLFRVVGTKRYKKAKIRKRCNQKKIPTPKTEVGKN